MSTPLLLLTQVLIIFLLIAVGYVCYRTKLITHEGNRQLSNLTLLVVTPAVLLKAYQTPFDPKLVKGLFWALGMAAFTHIVGIVIAQLFIRKNAKHNYVIEHFSIVYSNCGYMAIPLINAILGDIGVFYISAYITIFQIFTWTHGVFLMTAKREKKIVFDLLKSPVLISVAIGLVIFFFRLPIPSIVSTAIGHVASMNTPLAMIVTGVFLARSDLLRSFRTPRIYSIAALRLLVVPLICAIVFHFVCPEPTAAMTILIAAACPTAANVTLFAGRYNHDTEYASQILTITTLLSILTIPAIMWLYELL